MGCIRMRKYRAKGRKLVTDLLGSALASVTDGAIVPRSEPQSLATRTAQAVLRTTLLRHGVTQDRVVRVISEGLDSMRLVVKGDDISSQVDMQHRLRASDSAIKLLERAGELPGAKHSEPASHIVVNVMVLGEADGQQMRTIEAEEVDE
jgi:hypothetical protein